MRENFSGVPTTGISPRRGWVTRWTMPRSTVCGSFITCPRCGRGWRHVRLREDLQELLAVTVAEHLLEQRLQLHPVLDALLVDGELRIGGELVEAQGATSLAQKRFVGGGHEDPLAVTALEGR